MKVTSAKLDMPRLASRMRLAETFRFPEWLTDVNWYQVAVVAVATFAISMDIMFPPLKVDMGHGVGIYAGHAYVPLSLSGVIQVDFVWLAVELLIIVAAAVVGWRLGLPKSLTGKLKAGKS